MAGELTWAAAKAMFDANFNFRRSESEAGDRWYRLAANGETFWVKALNEEVLVGLKDPLMEIPEGVSEVSNNAFQENGLRSYCVETVRSLERLVSILKTAPAVNPSPHTLPWLYAILIYSAS